MVEHRRHKYNRFSTFTSVSSGYASRDDPYDSGYDHGCDDAGISSSERYINQPEKGPSFHTGIFMQGYNDGFDACSSRSGNGSRGDSVERDNRENLKLKGKDVQDESSEKSGLS